MRAPRRRAPAVAPSPVAVAATRRVWSERLSSYREEEESNRSPAASNLARTAHAAARTARSRAAALGAAKPATSWSSELAMLASRRLFASSAHVCSTVT
jgi:hypothetical protein